VSDSSLYVRAQAVLDRHPPVISPLQLSSAGFKHLLQTQLDFVAYLGEPTQVWLKLPSAPAWQTQLEQFCDRTASANPIYQLCRTVPTTTLSWPRLQRLQLAAPQALQREYLLLLISSSWTVLITAQLLRSPRSGDSPTFATLSLQDPDQIAAVLPFLQQAILAPAPPLPPLPTWAEIHPTLNHWATWQAQQQETLRYTASTYRRQALSASNLSSQNTELLNSLRLRDQFLNQASQALLTPVSSIQTALTLLESPNLKAPQRQLYIRLIRQACGQQTRLIKGVLDLLQLEHQLSQSLVPPLNLSDVVPGVVSTYQPLAQEHSVQLAYTIPQSLPPVACPEVWVRQIVIQLLENSLKYTAAGGQVRVTAHPYDEEIELLVRDTGVGIPVADLNKIFDPFFRGPAPVNGETEGAGLGLTVVQQILMYCGGSISVHSAPSQDTRFKVRLPIHSSVT
jgi:two-component system phosphate regulon sensor histidine kinase PhoR